MLAGCSSPPAPRDPSLDPRASTLTKSAAESSLKRFSFTELHMATVFRLVFYAPDETAANRAAEAAFQRIKALDDALTDYDPRSELRRISELPARQPALVSADLYAILDKAQSIARQTRGAFDVTVGPLVQLWRQARKDKILPSPPAIARAKQAVGFDHLRLDARRHTVTLLADGMRLDLGGIAKGYAADEALAVLRRSGIQRAMVAASGDIALGDPPPGRPGWTIAIESLGTDVQGTSPAVCLRNAGISTSGDAEQYIELGGQRYSHIVNPRTGLGLTERMGATVVARTATESDSLATAVCVLGAQAGLELADARPHTAALIATLEHGTRKSRPSKRFARLAPPAEAQPPQGPVKERTTE